VKSWPDNITEYVSEMELNNDPADNCIWLIGKLPVFVTVAINCVKITPLDSQLLVFVCAILSVHADELPVVDVDEEEVVGDELVVAETLPVVGDELVVAETPVVDDDDVDVDDADEVEVDGPEGQESWNNTKIVWEVAT